MTPERVEYVLGGGTLGAAVGAAIFAVYVLIEASLLYVGARYSLRETITRFWR